jgi:ribonuclease Z
LRGAWFCTCPYRSKNISFLTHLCVKTEKCAYEASHHTHHRQTHKHPTTRDCLIEMALNFVCKSWRFAYSPARTLALRKERIELKKQQNSQYSYPSSYSDVTSVASEPESQSILSRYTSVPVAAAATEVDIDTAAVVDTVTVTDMVARSDTETGTDVTTTAAAAATARRTPFGSKMHELILGTGQHDDYEDHDTHATYIDGSNHSVHHVPVGRAASAPVSPAMNASSAPHLGISDMKHPPHNGHNLYVFPYSTSAVSIVAGAGTPRGDDSVHPVMQSPLAWPRLRTPTEAETDAQVEYALAAMPRSKSDSTSSVNSCTSTNPSTPSDRSTKAMRKSLKRSKREERRRKNRDTFKMPRYELIGHSRSRERTCFWIPQLMWFFDAGFHNGSQVVAKNIFITHSHLDHTYSLPLLLGRNRTVTNIYCPAASAPYIEQHIQAVTNMNYSTTMDSTIHSYKLHPVKTGDRLRIEDDMEVCVIECEHTVPTVGYLLYFRRRKLRQEFFAKSGAELAWLAACDIELQEEVRVPVFSYIGDTSYRVFLQHPEILKFPIVVCECTFLDAAHVDRANLTRHTHWQQLRPIVAAHPEVSFILIHFSLRYRDEEIFDFFERENERRVASDKRPFDNVELWLHPTTFMRHAQYVPPGEIPHSTIKLPPCEQPSDPYDSDREILGNPFMHAEPCSPYASQTSSQYEDHVPDDLVPGYNAETRKAYGGVV